MAFKFVFALVLVAFSALANAEVVQNLAGLVPESMLEGLSHAMEKRDDVTREKRNTNGDYADRDYDDEEGHYDENYHENYNQNYDQNYNEDDDITTPAMPIPTSTSLPKSNGENSTNTDGGLLQENDEQDDDEQQNSHDITQRDNDYNLKNPNEYGVEDDDDDCDNVGEDDDEEKNGGSTHRCDSSTIMAKAKANTNTNTKPKANTNTNTMATATATATGSDKDLCSKVVAGLPDYSRCLQNDLDGKQVSLLSKHSGLVLDGPNNLKEISQEEVNGGLTQLFVLQRFRSLNSSDNIYYIRSFHTNEYLKGSTKNYARIFTSSNHPSLHLVESSQPSLPSQPSLQWIFEAKDGGFVIRTALAGNRAIDVRYSCPGNDVMLYSMHGGDNQIFYAIERSSLNCCSKSDCKDYRGLLSDTRSGMKCLRWDSHSHHHRPSRDPLAGLESNYCRNPSRANFAWCYVTLSGKKEGLSTGYWDRCVLPPCEANSEKATKNPQQGINEVYDDNDKNYGH